MHSVDEAIIKNLGSGLRVDDFMCLAQNHSLVHSTINN